MPDDIERLEIMPEKVMFADRNGEQQAEVITAVEGGGNRVYIELFSQIEGPAGEWYALDVYLGSKSAVLHESLYRIGQSPVHEISVRRNDFGILQLRDI